MRCFQFQGCTCEPQRRSISRVVKLAMYPSVLKILHRYTRLERAWTRFPSLSDRRTCRVTYIAVSNVPTVSFEPELFRVEVFWYTLRVEASSFVFATRIRSIGRWTKEFWKNRRNFFTNFFPFRCIVRILWAFS